MKFQYLVFALLLGLGGLLSCVTRTQKQEVDPPNILLIVADDLGYEKLGCYNGLSSSTPKLDRMASEGILFEHAYTSPVCTPSRMSIYTGTYPMTHQYTRVIPIHNGSKEAVNFSRWTTYAQLLQQNGYRTAVTGKWQMAGLEFHPEHCASAGFESWCVWQIWKEGRKTTRYRQATLNEDGRIRSDIDTRFGPDVLTDYVIRQMQMAQAEGRPFCIQHNMMLPHVPIVQTPDDQSLGEEASLDNMIHYLDKQVGLLLEAVQKLGLDQNTLVLFLGDNGTESEIARITSKGEVKGGKFTLTDAGMHVPLIAHWPGKIPPGHVNSDLIDFADLFPTICDLAGVEIPAEVDIDGISFHDLLFGKKKEGRQWVTAGYRGDYAVFDGEWRWHHVAQKLVDCRNLPREVESDLSSEEAQKARLKLEEIANNLLSSK